MICLLLNVELVRFEVVKSNVSSLEREIHTLRSGGECTLRETSAECDYYEEADERDEEERGEGIFSRSSKIRLGFAKTSL